MSYKQTPVKITGEMDWHLVAGYFTVKSTDFCTMRQRIVQFSDIACILIIYDTQKNDVVLTSMQRDDVAATSIWRHSEVITPCACWLIMLKKLLKPSLWTTAALSFLQRVRSRLNQKYKNEEINPKKMAVNKLLTLKTTLLFIQRI